MSILEATDLVLGYAEEAVLDGVNLHVNRGELVTVVGTNGSGKSTLLSALAGNLRPRAGKVRLEGRLISEMRSIEVARKLVFLPQVRVAPEGFTVRDIVGFGRHPYCDWTGRLTKKDQQVIDWALEVTALEALQDRTVGKISGGEKQRAWIAMALAQKPEVMLLDEPTTFLDIAFQLQLLELLRALNRRLRLAIVMVLHDLNQAARYSERMIVLNNGVVYREGPPAEVVTEAMLAEVFGVKARIMSDSVHNRPHFIAALETKGPVGE